MISKRGNASVFLVFVMTALIGAAGAFILASKITAYTSVSDGLINLSMRSVMSEFDLTLKERYGILAFEKDSLDTSLEIGDYIDYSLNGENAVKNISVSAGKYLLSDINVLEAQICEYMKAGENFEHSGRERAIRKEYTDRTLRNRAVTETLPSKPFRNDNDFLDRIEQFKNNIDSVDGIFDSASKEYLVNKYILSHFKHAAGGPVNEMSFFEHEVEYILTGGFSNEENREKVKTGLRILRTALNIAYLYKDEDKRNKTLAAAELLTPGSAVATQAVLIATWATAEGKNDVKLLMDGKCVPFMKSGSSWATDLDKVLSNTSSEYIDPGNEEGLYYEDYLMVFLSFMDDTVKLSRVADLIQINMKLTQDRGFLMYTCKTGFNLKAEIYGREHEYETCY